MPFLDPAVLAFFAVGAVGFWLLLAISAVAFVACAAKESGIGATITLVATVLLLSFLCGAPLGRLVIHHPWITAGIVGLYLVAGVIWSFPRWILYSDDQKDEFAEAKERYVAELNAYELRLKEAIDNNAKAAVAAAKAREVLGKGNAINADGDLILPTIGGDELTPTEQNAQRVLQEANDVAWQLKQVKEKDMSWKRWLERHPIGECRYCGCEVKPLARNHKADIIRWMSYWPASLTWTAIDFAFHKFFGKIYKMLQQFYQDLTDKMFTSVEVEVQELRSKSEAVEKLKAESAQK